MVWNALSGTALAAIAVAVAMIVFIVRRLVVEAAATGSTRKKLPVHILLVGVGTLIWGAAQADTVLDHLGGGALPPEWSAAPAALVGSLLLGAGLWMMVEFQSRTYKTLGGGASLEEGDAGGDEAVQNREALTRLRVEIRVFNALLFVGIIFGFAQTERQTNDLESLARAQVVADRQGCERQNVVRTNQAGGIQDQIDQNAVSLKRNLGSALEPFRKEIEGGQTARRERVKKLRDSLNGKAKKGKPYEIDCVLAFPFRK